MQIENTNAQLIRLGMLKENQLYYTHLEDYDIDDLELFVALQVYPVYNVLNYLKITRAAVKK
jgi:hypothetical protein